MGEVQYNLLLILLLLLLLLLFKPVYFCGNFELNFFHEISRVWPRRGTREKTRYLVFGVQRVKGSASQMMFVWY